MGSLQFDVRFAYPSGFSLDFSFATEHRITALVGPSGCGKSTVLNLIAGLLPPSSGSIVLDGHPLFDAEKGINLRPETRRVGYVFQDYLLFPHLTVRENLQYGLKRAHEVGGDFEQIVTVLELAPLLLRYPASLSGGQKQRVAVGRAILRRPQLLLLDEPLSALDANLRESVASYLAQAIEAANVPTLLVSHDKQSIAWLAHAEIAMPASGRGRDGAT